MLGRGEQERQRLPLPECQAESNRTVAILRRPLASETMPSVALAEWNGSARARLDELERVHADAQGTGHRWGTE
jgi:hypothetical protein